MKLIDTKCDVCGKIFKRFNWHVKLNKRRKISTCCSKKCRDIFNTTKITFKCLNCGKEAQHIKYQYYKKKNKNHFCSRKCSTTWLNKNTHREKTGIYIYRKRALKHYGHQCTVPGCGYNILKVLQVHHRDKDRNNNTISNLDVLCPTHHKEYELGIRKYE